MSPPDQNEDQTEAHTEDRPVDGATPAESGGNGEPVELFDLMLVVLALVAFALAALRIFFLGEDSGDRELVLLVEYLDLGICAVFFADFVRSLVKAEDRWRYFRTWGWFDLLSSTPVILFDPVFMGQGSGWLGGLTRSLRLARLIRVLRAIRSLRILYGVARRDPSVAVLAGLLLSGIVLFVSCCIGVLWAETRPGVEGADLVTAADVVWWAVVTSSTVGYGDLAPVTDVGRVFAVGLMLVGIGAFATLTSAFGVLIGRVRRRGRDPQDEIVERLDRLEATLGRLERRLDRDDR